MCIKNREMTKTDRHTDRQRQSDRYGDNDKDRQTDRLREGDEQSGREPERVADLSARYTKCPIEDQVTSQRVTENGPRDQ